MKKSRVMALVLATALCLGCMAGYTKPAKADSENLIVNGNFDDPDNLEVWNEHQSGATITAETSDTPIGDTKIKTYGKITNRTSNYQSFAQDVLGKIEKGEVYEYSFYIMLDPEDYKDASAEMRTVEISPHVRTNLGNTYSQGVSGTVTQVLEPGVWTKISGTFSPTWNGDVELVALRFLEQGTQYGSGPGVMGTYYLTGVELYLQDKQPELIQKNIVNLDDAVNKKLNANGEFIVGTAVTGFEAMDVEVMGLITKHFNGLTLGNELKPESLLAESYKKDGPTQTVIFNGEELLVPVMNFSSAERILDMIYKWNSKNPDNQIKIRGHVLVWHSQTPDWFFREGYKGDGALVDKETMNKRLEWYIATVAEHFNSPDSKYYGMFYAWDVVNEAISDSGGAYRSDKENSRWWEIYQSNEFIINAFRYANKYMPEDIDLFYNDYGDASLVKSKGIAQLLRDVKEAEGTRIDGMGMQGHYQTQSNPSVTDFELAVKLYASVVDQIQITEWDMAVTPGYVPSEKNTPLEYRRQAKRYYALYEAIINLREQGINFTGMTFWGTVDKYSWLQDESTVGGGSDGLLEQVPLLFDSNYQVKPAFWAFADWAKYDQVIKPTPTPTVKPQPTKAPTAAPTESPENLSSTPTPAEAGTPTGAIGIVLPIAVGVAVMAAGIVGGVIYKKKRK